MLETIRQYLTLEISAREFSDRIQRDDALLAFVQARIPPTVNRKPEDWVGFPLDVRRFSRDKFDLRRTLTRGEYALTLLGSCARAYRLLYELFCADLPDVSRSDYYENLFEFALDAVPEIYDSLEASPVLFKILEDTRDMKKTARKKAVKEAIAESFPVAEGKKKPNWAQDSEWPVAGSGKPMRFMGQKKMGERVEYTFEDVDTLEKRIIEQFY